MPYHARRMLLVFTNHLNDAATLQKDIQHTARMMRRIAIFGLPLPEYFVLVVTPCIPANFQRLPEIQAYVRRHTEEALKRLEQIGVALGIPSERQCLAGGNANLEARRVSKVLGIDEVYGYSKSFEGFLKLCEVIQSRWQGLFNKASWPSVRKRCKQRPQRVVGMRSNHLTKR